MTQTKPDLTLHINADPDYITIPQKLRIEKEGPETRAYCAETGAQLMPLGAVKVDLSNGKGSKAKLTFECEVAEVVMLEPQLSLPMGGTKN